MFVHMRPYRKDTNSGQDLAKLPTNGCPKETVFGQGARRAGFLPRREGGGVRGGAFYLGKFACKAPRTPPAPPILRGNPAIPQLPPAIASRASSKSRLELDPAASIGTLSPPIVTTK